MLFRSASIANGVIPVEQRERYREALALVTKAWSAREVFASSLAVVFQVTGEGEALQETLLSRMREARAPSGYPLFTVSSVLGLLVFFMIALQCLSTVVVAAREAGTWTFAALQLSVFNLVAYVLAVVLVQGLRAFGVS